MKERPKRGSLVGKWSLTLPLLGFDEIKRVRPQGRSNLIDQEPEENSEVKRK